MNAYSAEEFIGPRLMAYLKSRTPPKMILGKPEMQADEADRILRALCRFNPGGNLDAWWQRVEDELSLICETYSWPLPKHFATAADRASKSQLRGNAAPAGTSWTPDPVKINANRMNAGEPVGEDWLYGPYAVAIEDSGLVSAETLTAYRSGAYFARIVRKRDGTDDKSKADAWEKEVRKAHRAARERVGASGSAPSIASLVKRISKPKESASGPGAHEMRPEEYMTAEEIAREDGDV